MSSASSDISRESSAVATNEEGDGFRNKAEAEAEKSKGKKVAEHKVEDEGDDPHEAKYDEEASQALEQQDEREGEETMKPFRLRKVPEDTRYGKLYREYEDRYWRMRKAGNLGDYSKHFRLNYAERMELTPAEQAGFRLLARHFTDMKHSRGRCKKKVVKNWRRNRFGPRDFFQKTPAQRIATRVNSLKSTLNRKMNAILAQREGAEWVEMDTDRLQQLNQLIKFKQRDKTIELYKEVLKANPDMVSCIPLPP